MAAATTNSSALHGDIASNDPFAAQRTAENNPFSTGQSAAAQHLNDPTADSAVVDSEGPNPTALSSSPSDRRISREWDASKVPPSQFQKRKGSIYATPGSRDSHHQNPERDQKYHDKIKEKEGSGRSWNPFSSKK